MFTSNSTKLNSVPIIAYNSNVHFARNVPFSQTRSHIHIYRENVALKSQVWGSLTLAQLIMHENSLRSRLSGVILTWPVLSFACCLCAVAHTKPLRTRKNMGGQGSTENGWVLSQNLVGGRLPGTGVHTLTRPKTGGWAHIWEWALTWDNMVLAMTSQNLILS